MAAARMQAFLLCSTACAFSTGAPPSAVSKVHVLFTHHLDVGLDIQLKLTEDCVGFATKIVQRYFDIFIPRAIRLAQQQRSRGGPRFAYTMHPWILSLYVDCDAWAVEDGCPLNEGILRCPSPAQVATFDAAARRGDILWAASPMNLDPGAVGSPELFKELMTVASGLDTRYNISKKAQVWSNVDVPGFVRSSIPLLTQVGVKFLSIGANGGALGIKEDAKMWRWREPASGEEVVVVSALDHLLNSQRTASFDLCESARPADVSQWLRLALRRVTIRLWRQLYPELEPGDRLRRRPGLLFPLRQHWSTRQPRRD